MNHVFSIMERFAPEALEIMVIRYQILRQVLHHQPVGRRQLGNTLGYTERTIRSEVDYLKMRGAIHTTSAGICLTPYGEEMLSEIDEFIPFLYNTQTLAERIKQKFSLREVIVVPGDSYQDNTVKKDLGMAAARQVNKLLFAGCTLAVTGGTTLAEMAAAMCQGNNTADILVVPARGGLGEEMEQQAGAIAARIAKAIGAQYRLLHIPDNLEEGTAEILKNDVHIQRVLDSIKSSDILVHGIGPAMEMANRRGLFAPELFLLEQKQAVGEALRYYFDKKGNIVYEVPGIGLELDDLKNTSEVIAVAGGSNKGEAIQAVLNGKRNTMLITDEGAANKICS